MPERSSTPARRSVISPRGTAFTAAVIGSGFGGIAAAIRLQASGLRTVLFEARDQPGGRASVFERDGFTFDAGPTVITAPECIDELFTDVGRDRRSFVEFMPVTPFYRLLWEDGTVIDYTSGEGLEREVSRISPSDLDGYRRFAEYTRRVYEKGYRDLAAVPFLNFSDMVRTIPSLARLRADRSVYRTVSGFVRNEALRQALSFHSLLVGGNPFETSSIYTLIHHLEKSGGVFFPRGGTGALVRALLRLFEQLGGELRLSTPVEQITLVGEGRVLQHQIQTRAFGSELFDLVVSNADVHHTYSRLYAGHPAARRMQRKLERADWSMSLFVLYFGTNRSYDLAHHTVLFGKRYRELLDGIFHGNQLPEDFSLYLHAPTVTDPSLAPPGSAAYYVLSPVPHLGNAPLDWDTLGARYRDRIFGALERWMPDLRKHVVQSFWMSPKDFERDLYARHGSAFSLAPHLTQSAWFRPKNRDPSIPGLYLVGAGTHPGAGVPGVINSAKATVRVVLSDLKQRLAS